MFEKSLNELIKGIRAHKGSEAKYIDAAIADCRKEVKSKDMDIKAKAVLKLAYVPPLHCSSTLTAATNVRVRVFVGVVPGH